MAFCSAVKFVYITGGTMRCPRPVLLALVLGLAAPATAHAQKPNSRGASAPAGPNHRRLWLSSAGARDRQDRQNNTVDGQGDPVRATETYPGSKYVLTNLQTHRQTQLSIVGPAFYEFRPDGSFTVTGTGPWGWYPENPVTGEPGIFSIRERLNLHGRRRRELLVPSD